MKVTISDKAKAVAAIVDELETVSHAQLNLAESMAGLLMMQAQLGQKSAALHNTLKELLK